MLNNEVAKDGYKYCSDCGLEVILSEFFKDKKGKLGVGSKCKDCFYKAKGIPRPEAKPIAKDGYKFCSKCKQEKLKSEFYPDLRASDGLNSQCRICNLGYGNKEPGKLSYLRDIPIEPEGWRYCPSCQDMKTLDKFELYKDGKFYRRDCIECRRKDGREYAHEHYQEHKTYIEANKQRWLDYHKQYHILNRVTQLLIRKQRRIDKPDVVRLEIKNSRLKKITYYRSLDVIKQSRRRARVKGLPNTLTIREWEACLQYFDSKCAVCGITADTSVRRNIVGDHWIPIADKRLNNPGTVVANLIPLCHASKGGTATNCCNNSKGAKDPIEWLYSRYPKDEADVILERINTYFESVKVATA